MEKKNKGGRPKTTVNQKLSKVKIDIERVKKIAKYGLTDVELGDVLGVDERTIRRWKENPDFLSALKSGKLEADKHIINSLYHRAKGIKYTEITTEKDKEGKVLRTKTITKFIPPDVTGAIYWLNNRQPDKWNNKNYKVAGDEENEMIFEGWDW